VYADGLVDDLSGVTNPVTARDNLGLGTASTNPATAFATAAQGLLSDSALQPGDSNTNLVNDAGYLTTETDPVASSNLTAHIDDTTAAHVATAISTTGTYSTVQGWLSALGTMAYQAASSYLLLTGGTLSGALTLPDLVINGDWMAGSSKIARSDTNGLISISGGTSANPGGYISVYGPGTAGTGVPRVVLNGNGGPVSIAVQTTKIEGNNVPYTNGCFRGTVAGGEFPDLGSLADLDSLPASSVTITNTEGNVQASITALKAADTSADRTPYLIAYASTVTVSRANTDLQQLHPITGPCTIVFPSGVTNYASCIELVIPPVGTQTVALATGPTYYYGDSLTGPSPTNYTHALWQTVYGTTGTTVRLYRGEAQ
jgi:hypothetical protein